MKTVEIIYTLSIAIGFYDTFKKSKGQEYKEEFILSGMFVSMIPILNTLNSILIVYERITGKKQ